MKHLLTFLSHAWFPVALLGLFALALPGLVLVVLTLLELDRPINVWLEENLSISYQLAVNPWIALVLLLLPLVLIILYFLKLKRKPIQVPSTFLWKKSIEDLHVNTLFQWLRHNVLLVLQILVILFLIYSVLGLRIHGQVSQGRHYILLIDNSASMSATDVAPNRLEWAKAEALKEIDGAGDDDYGMVIVFNSKATTLQGYTNNRGKLRDAVRSIEPTSRVTRIDEALALADSLANPVRSTEDMASRPDDVTPGQERTFGREALGIDTAVHLYSDGRYAKLTEAALASLNARLAGSTKALGNLNLRYHAAGKLDAANVDNVGIVGLSAVPYLGPATAKKAADLDLQKLLVMVQVANFRPDKTQVKLKLDVFVDGQLFHPEQKTLSLKARRVETPADPAKEEEDRPGLETVDLKLPPIDRTRNVVLHAYLDKHKDAFAADDQAWLAIGATRKAKVLIVGPNNRVLDAFFEQEGMERRATVERLSVDELGGEKYRKHARGGDVDLVIFDRCAPTEEIDLPLASTYFIDRLPPPWHRGKATFRPPLVTPSKGNHPLLRHITSLSEVRIAEAFEFDLLQDLDPKAREQLKLPDADPAKRVLPTMTRIAESGGQKPLLFSLARGPYLDIVQTFPLINDKGELVSDWPLQVSFALFFQNVLYTVARVDDAVRAVAVQAGEPVVLRPEAGVKTLEITKPSGTLVKLQRGQRPDFVFAETDRLGVYGYKPLDEDGAAKEGLPRSFAVNLLDQGESNIEPRAEVRIGSERVSAGQERQQPREIWKWILVLAAVLLMTEWLIYNRRIAV